MGRALPIILVALAVALAGCGKSEKRAAHPSPIAEAVPLGLLPRAAVPVRYRLSFVIDPRRDGFTGHDEIDVIFAAPRRTLYLHGQGLDISGVEVKLPSGKAIPAHYDQVDRSGVARLVFVDKVPRGPATLIFDYEAKFDRSLSGLYKVVDRGGAYAFTQFEATDARRAFPSFDEPGFKTPFEITVVAPAGDSVIGNAEVKSVLPAAKGMKRVVFAATKPLPTYLVALAVGPFDIVESAVAPNQVRDRPLRLRGVAAKGRGAQLRHALALTSKIVTALEDYFGVAYPYPKLDMLAVPDFGPGGMENAGAVFLRERLFLFDSTAPLEQKRTSLLVQAHELAHQWFGDLVTPKWWDDIWLNESLATWMEAKAAAMVMPGWQFDSETLRDGFDVMRIDELASARQIHQPVRGEDDISDAFDDISYDKGAAVLAMFDDYLGPEVWRAGIHAYLSKYAYGNATAKDFIGTIARESAHPEIVAALDSYIDQPNIPLLRFAKRCGAGGPRADIAQVAVSGQGARPRHWYVPVCVEAAGAKKCLLLSGSAAVVPLGRCPFWIMPNADGKGYYRFTLDDKGWRALIAAAPKLKPADQITLLENLYAALRSGNAKAGDLFALIRALAPRARWDVLDRIAGILHRLRESGLAGNDLTAYRAFVRWHFAPRLHAVGLAERRGETAETTLTRAVLAKLLVAEGADPLTIAELSAVAHGYVASAGRRTGNLAPDLLGEALRAALSADPPFADALARAFTASDDENFRRTVIYAFSGNDNPAVIGKLLALAPKMRTGELHYLYQFMAAEPVARGALWSWFEANYDAIVARVSTQGMSHSVTILEEACDPGARGALEAFFRPKTGVLQGTARPLALAEERIDGCIAFKSAKWKEIAAALQGQF